MNKEVKEIMELIGNAYYYGSITDEQKEKYCNYITSLEEENERLKNLEYKFFDDCGDEESFTLNDYLELGNKLYDLEEENEHLKFHLNDVVFDEHNIDVELGARLLRKLGYCDFDDVRQVYVNKHNNEPFMQEEVKEKAFYIQDDKLDDYTQQLESKINQAIFIYEIRNTNEGKKLRFFEGKHTHDLMYEALKEGK